MSSMEPDPALAAALCKLITTMRTPKRKWSVAAIERALIRNYQDYGAPARGLSEPVITDAKEGRPISWKTKDILRKFIHVNAPGLLTPLIPPVDLDLGTFFGTGTSEMTRAGRRIVGTYQTYARSTSMPAYLRRGRMRFDYVDDDDKQRIAVVEEQLRPAIEGREEWPLRWDGFAAPRGRSYFVVMRIPEDAYGPGTASLGIIDVATSGPGVVREAIFHGLQYDGEKPGYLKFTCLLMRTQADCIMDYVKLVDLTDKEQFIIDALCLAEEIEKLRTARHR
ncbi:MAG TPA: hypothetical protein PK264_05235 [Hyphomicrobiaceae bacterium]|nr:hypothetical protein [Hyphomicrobiaceae bacterium]